MIFVIVSLLCCRYIYIQTKTSIDFLEILKNENVEDLTLTIYHCDPRYLSSYNYSSKEELIEAEKHGYVYKIVVNGETLKKHIDSFVQINNGTIQPIYKKAKYVDATTYYILESKNNKKIFDVLLWGLYNTPAEEAVIFFNGFEIKRNQVFSDIIKPFLPVDIKNSVDW